MTRFLSCLSAVALSAVVSAGPVLVFDTEDYPPFNMYDQGKVGGISTEIIQEALRRTNIAGSFQILPWARSLAETRTLSDRCIYSAVRTAQREPWYKWVAPLVDDHITLFALSDSTITLKAMADAKRYKVGGYVDDAYGDYVERQGIVLDRAPSDTLNLQKLIARRIDLWVGGAISAPYRAAREGQAGTIKPIVGGGDAKDSTMWLACNPNVPDNVVQTLREAVDAEQKDGFAAKVAAKYR
jgi:polar amino acid transport system substrate-binding protein